MDKNNISDIVDKAKTGNIDAFSKLFELTQSKAYYTALKITKNSEDAQDILQDAYVKAFTSLDQLKENSKFQSWFNCIVANKCKNYVAKLKPNLFSEYESDDEDYAFEDLLENKDNSLLPQAVIDNKETKRIIMECIDRLPEDQRICVLMYYYDELSIKEIAQSLGISEGTVKSRLNTARKKLKKEFKKLEDDGTPLYSIPFIPLIRWAFTLDEKKQRAKKTVAGKIKRSILTELKKSSVLPIASKAYATAIFSNKIVAGVIAVAVGVSAIAGGIAAYNNSREKASDAVLTTSFAEHSEEEAEKATPLNNDYCCNGDFVVCDKDKSKIFYMNDDSVIMANYNGDNPKTIFNNKPFNLVFTDKLYFSYEGMLYSYENNELTENFVVNSYYLYSVDDYFVGIGNSKDKAYIIDLSEKSEKSLNIAGSNIAFNDNYLYYRGANQNVYRISPTTPNSIEAVVIYDENYNISLPYHITDNTVYYSDFKSDETGDIYFSNIGASEKNRINIGNGIVDFSVTDNSIYYADSKGSLYKCDKNGSNHTLISNGSFGYSCSTDKYQIWYDSSEKKSYLLALDDASFCKTFIGCISNAQIIGSEIFYLTDGHIYHSQISE